MSCLMEGACKEHTSHSMPFDMRRKSQRRNRNVITRNHKGKESNESGKTVAMHHKIKGAAPAGDAPHMYKNVIPVTMDVNVSAGGVYTTVIICICC